MATLVLGAAGKAVGGLIGGSILGASAATIGGFVGATVGQVIDSAIVGALAPAQRIDGPRLDSIRLTSSTEGAVIPRVYGRHRVGGNIIWATDFREVKETETRGGKGGGPSVKTTEYTYFASFAVAICEGPITGIGRIWADSQEMDTTGITMRVYTGSETQVADTLIASFATAGMTPAYRGTAYVVFEDFPLSDYGNQIPQMSFEVFRPLAESDTAEGLITAVTLIPGSGEFVYATTPIRQETDGETLSENQRARVDMTDIQAALDQLQACAPNVESVTLVVSWFGDDLRAGSCKIRPGVEATDKKVKPEDWQVSGVTRASAHVVSQGDAGAPNYGGTPSDASIIEAIAELKARGLRVTFYPFILMDVPPGNTLPNPYSDNTAETGQPAFPWRGRITCSPAAGYVGTVDKTATAADQVSAFFGPATVADVPETDGALPVWDGAADDWGYRRMVLHYARLCQMAGGVDSFIIGSELRGLTQIRSDASTYPAVAHLQQLAADVRDVMATVTTKVSYAADWSEYHSHRPADGTGDVYFNLDPLWADANIDFVAIDNYLPLSDWRDGFDHLDAAEGWPAIYDRAYLQANVEAGEWADWYYASDADRATQTRTTISDGAYGKPWVFGNKAIRDWWSNAHYNRPGGVESGTATAWTAQGKPIRFTEFGCPAVDRGTNQPNVFYDPKSSESFTPYFSRGWRDDAIQRAYLEATLLYWAENSPTSAVYAGPMIDLSDCAVWTWDARPYPHFPALADVWADGGNWQLGHWITGRIGSAGLPALVRTLCLRGGMTADQIDVTGLWGAVEGYAVTALESPRASIAALQRHFGFDALESQGILRFVMRGRGPVAALTPDDLVQTGDDVFELTRGQETELPQALKWTAARSDEEYDAATSEARRAIVQAARESAETFPFATPPEEIDRRVRRALMEAWVGRESAAFSLPPSRLALDPGDVVGLTHDGRTLDYHIRRTADGEARGIEAVLYDREVYDLPPGQARPATLAGPPVYGGMVVEIMDLPILAEGQTPHRPLVAAYASPWHGTARIYNSTTLDNFKKVNDFTEVATFGALVNDLPAGPLWRFDQANTLTIDLWSGQMVSITDDDLFAGGNAMAVESAPGVWEIVQAGTATLVSPGRYALTRLLRGQRGTEWAMGDPTPAGARVVLLNGNLAEVEISENKLGIAYNWRVGPADASVDDERFAAIALTPQGAGLRMFSPVHLRLTGWPTVTATFVARSRELIADSWDQVEVPADPNDAGFELDVLYLGNLIATVSGAASPLSWTWDAGSGVPDTAGTQIVFRLYHLSRKVGRGPMVHATLTL